jgi:hypothetical protein
VHDFCERIEVPCLFPHTDLPVVSPSGAYALYFSQGLTAEAEALARYLHERLQLNTHLVLAITDTTSSDRSKGGQKLGPRITLFCIYRTIVPLGCSAHNRNHFPATCNPLVAQACAEAVELRSGTYRLSYSLALTLLHPCANSKNP